MLIFSTKIVNKFKSIIPMITKCGYAADSKKVGASLKKVELPVETDAYRLVNYVCGTNILKEGGEDIKLKPESEYPDWLYDLYLGPPKDIKEMDPKSKQYWLRVRLLAMRRNNLKAKQKRTYVKPY